MDDKHIIKKAYRYLSIQARSSQEISDYLLRKKIDPRQIQKVIEKLEQQGFVNDKDFTSQYINSYVKKGFGPKKIYFNLLKKGIDKQDIKRTLDDISDPEWIKQAKKVIAKKDSQLKQLDEYKVRQKIYNLLTYKGFQQRVIKSVIDAYPHLE